MTLHPSDFPEISQARMDKLNKLTEDQLIFAIAGDGKPYSSSEGKTMVPILITALDSKKRMANKNKFIITLVVSGLALAISVTSLVFSVIE